jgi:hypothetical protein
MNLKPFKEIVAYTKEKVTEVMAAPRARRLKAQAESELSDLDIEIITIEGKVEESLYAEDSYKNFSFKILLEQLDKLALLERRKKQYTKVLKQLFPEDA